MKNIDARNRNAILAVSLSVDDQAVLKQYQPSKQSGRSERSKLSGNRGKDKKSRAKCKKMCYKKKAGTGFEPA